MSNLSFQSQTTFAANSTVRAIATGDFNGDGNLDVVAANAQVGANSSDPDTVSILLGNGSGGFSSAASIAVGDYPNKVIVADLNGDDRDDLIVSNGNSDTIGILLGNGLGGFSSQTTFQAGDYPNAITVGDFNGDGKTDVATSDGNSSSVSVLLGNGSGGFSSQTTFATLDSYPYGIVAADFNGDGKDDLAVTNSGSQANSNAFSVFLSNGSGGFSSQGTFAAGNYPTAIVADDFNDDGKIDIAVSNGSSDSISVFLGNGSGGFSSQTTFATGDEPYTIVAGDVNGDRIVDLLVANFEQDNVSVLLGNGSGGFSSQTTYAVGNTPYMVVVDDFNNDGRLDIVTGNRNDGSISLLLNTTDFPPAAESISLPTAGTYTIGQTLDFTVSFSEVVTVSTGGKPFINLTIGAKAVKAEYLSGSGTDQLVFRYTLVSGESDTDGIAIGNVIDLNGATIKDATNNNAFLDFTVPSAANVRVNAIPAPAPTPTPDADGPLGVLPTVINFKQGKAGLRLVGNAAVNVINGGKNRDIINGRGGDDRMFGRQGNDQMRGGKGNDRVNGGDGNDLVQGEVGNDRLIGGKGDDVIVGGQGFDVMIGSAGKDLFVISELGETDTIQDFNTAEDLIDLRGIFARPEFTAASAFQEFKQFIQLVQVGSGTEVRIDKDGTGAGTEFSTLVVLPNVASTTIGSKNFVIA